MTTFQKRKSPRIKGFDYSADNYYFVTLCTHEKTLIFGMDDKLTAFGKIAERHLTELSSHYECVSLERYVIMPNHIHAVIRIDKGVINAENAPDLSTVIGLYKSGVSKVIHKIDPNLAVWQSSFYDHIIRDDRSYEEICRYIDDNPLMWKMGKDKYYN